MHKRSCIPSILVSERPPPCVQASNLIRQVDDVCSHGTALYRSQIGYQHRIELHLFLVR